MANKHKVFLDCCILMDYFSERPGGNAVESIFALSQQGKIECFTSSNIICTIAYLFEKYKIVSKKELPTVIKELSSIVKILPIDAKDIDNAISFSSGDFEDDVERSCAERFCLNIITDNYKDFRNCKVDVYTPQEFLTIVLSEMIQE